MVGNGHFSRTGLPCQDTLVWDDYREAALTDYNNIVILATIVWNIEYYHYYLFSGRRQDFCSVTRVY